MANRIEALKIVEDDNLDAADREDLPVNARQAAGEAVAALNTDKGLNIPTQSNGTTSRQRLSNLAKGAIFREVVLAKVREVKDQAERDRVAASAAAGKELA